MGDFALVGTSSHAAKRAHLNPMERAVPDYARTLLCLLAICFAATASARAQPSTLTESSVIRLAQRNANAAHAKIAQSKYSAATAESALQLPNPQLQWQRTDLLGDNRSEGSEDQLTVIAPIDLSGRRQTRAALAQTQMALSRASAHQLQSRAVQRAVALFFTGLAAESRADALARGVLQLENASRIVEARHAAGSASGQDSLRLQLELELTRSVAVEARAESVRVKASLAAILALQDPSPQLKGTLTPPPLAVQRTDNEVKLKSANTLQTALKSSQNAQDASKTAWIPKVQLQAGLVIADEQSTQFGYVAGVNLAMPFFTTNQALGKQASARQAQVHARIAAAKQQVRNQTASAQAAYSYASKELQRFEANALIKAQTLVSSATVSYQQGASNLITLLDAQRTQTLIAERQINLQLQTRLAEVALREASGDFE